jgi:transmembrane sensor
MTMSDTQREIEDRALDWIILQADPNFDAWEDFAAWLGADPVHAETYQAMAVADMDAARTLSTEPVIPARSQPSRKWVRWPVAAIAAAGIAVFGYSLQDKTPDSFAIETAAGQQRTVTLADGSRVTLDGNTRVVGDSGDARRVSLERGEAVFAVVHDAAKPFTVTVGAATLLDVGTVFSVTRENSRTSVRVAEGAVVYNPKSEKVRLDAGMTLRADDGAASVVVGRTDPATIAGWRNGRLVYDGAPLGDVVADVARTTGLKFDVGPELSGRTFRGVIALDGGGDAVMRRLRILLDVDIERRGAAWKMSAKR